MYRKGYWTGSQGFGDAKITSKHNLTKQAVMAVTKYPDPFTGIVPEDSYNTKYTSPVIHVKCGGFLIFKSCKVVEKVTVKAVVNYGIRKDGNAMGVITAYCLGYTGMCPSWVKNALNI